jgi:hypothetical protein
MLVGLLLLGLRCAAVSDEAHCLASASRHTGTEAIVNPSSICVPEGRFVAIRKANWQGALRFVELRDRNAAALEGCARYELYTLGGAVAKSTGVVSSFGSRGVHPLVHERGQQAIRGRGLTIRYAHPGCLSLMANRGLELAVTPWRTIEEVNLGDERLQWVSFDPSGTRSPYIPPAFFTNP